MIHACLRSGDVEFKCPSPAGALRTARCPLGVFTENRKLRGVPVSHAWEQSPTLAGQTAGQACTTNNNAPWIQPDFSDLRVMIVAQGYSTPTSNIQRRKGQVATAAAEIQG